MSPQQMAGHEEVELPDISLADYNRFMAGARLESIEHLRLHAERLSVGEVGGVELTVTPEIAVDDFKAFLRYDASLTITDEGGDALGTVSAVIVVAFACDEKEPASDVVSRFALTTGLLVAHPYLREAVQNLGNRVGFPQLAIPLMPIPG